MNYLRQSLFGLVVVGLICAVGMFALIQVHLDTIYGGRVELADHTAFRTDAGLTAIRNVSVLAPSGERMLAGRTVVFDGQSIVSVEEAGAVPEQARVIDGTDHFLIPGLIDGHVQLRRQPNDLLLYVANGVTQVRQLAGRPADLELKAEIENGRIGPALYVSSPSLYTAGRIEGWWISITRPALNLRHTGRAERVVEMLTEAGYDAIKTDSSLDLESFDQVNSAAADLNRYTIGALPKDFDLNDLAASQLAEIAQIEELVKKLLDEFVPYYERGSHQGFLAYVQQRTPQIVDDLLASGAAVNSTLWFMDTLEHQAGDLIRALEQTPLAFANPAMVEGSRYIGMGWLPGMNRFQLPPDLDDERRDNTIEFWRARAQAHKILLRAMAAREVPITIGSNASAELMIAGFSLHQELETLQQSGLTPAQALATATQVPARLMQTSTGTIAPGQTPDMVLLRSNPLANIANTRSIETVVLDGKVLDRTTLDEMLEAVETAHAQSRKFDLDRYQ